MSSMTTGSDLETLRVDIVGSFLRPASLKSAFAGHASGALGEDGLRAVQDAAIRALVAAEEKHGLPIVTDGEFRRRSFMQSFAVVKGMEPWYSVIARPSAERPPDPNEPKREMGNEVRSPVTARLELLSNAPLDEYTFTASCTTRPATVTIIGPDRFSQRYNAEQSTSVYPSTQQFVDDVVAIEQQDDRPSCALPAAATCTWTRRAIRRSSMPEPWPRCARAARIPRRTSPRSIAADNAIVQAFPDLIFGVHLCRGNSRELSHRKGGYDAVAERLFGSLAHQRLLLEYDDERSGGLSRCVSSRRGRSSSWA